MGKTYTQKRRFPNNIAHKRLAAIVLTFFFSVVAFFPLSAQTYTNSWINYNQQYFKIKVASTGIYRVSYSALVASGVPVTSLDPRSIQIFARGEEQYIHIHNTGQAGTFDTDDYIEFYGERNNGWLDSALYKNADEHTNTDYSVYNDTAVYFLTWNTSLTNRRLQCEYNANFSGYSAASWYMAHLRFNYSSSYNFGILEYDGKTDPEFTAGEGWTDSPFGIGSFVTKQFTLSNIYDAGPDATISTALASASNYQGPSPDHHINISYKSHVIDDSYEGYGYHRYSMSIPPAELDEQVNQIAYYSIDDYPGVDNVSYNKLVYLDIMYPRSFAMASKASEHLVVPESGSDKTMITLTDLPAVEADSVFLYDFINHKRIWMYYHSGEWSALVTNTGQDPDCYYFCPSVVGTIPRAYAVDANTATFARFTDYGTPAAKSSDYLILSHPFLMDQVGAYSDYREAKFTPLVVNVQQLYDQFAYGVGKHPVAISNYLKYAIGTYDTIPDYLFIIGKAFKPEVYRNNTDRYKNTLVPSCGNPVSDVLFTADLETGQYRPKIATGRLSAINSFDVYLYLNKVIEYEQAQADALQVPQDWMKHILHFGGGSNIAQQSIIRDYLRIYQDTLEGCHFGGIVTEFLKSSSAPIAPTASDSLTDRINAGVSLMTFFAHGAGGVGLEVDIGDPEDYSNQGRYPILVANSCLTGDMFEASETATEKWVLVENHGAIAYISSITRGLMSKLHDYSTALFGNITNTSYHLGIGKAMQNAIADIQTPDDFYIKEVCFEMGLHGDPAIIPNSFPRPDYLITADLVYTEPSVVTTERDSFDLILMPKNLGMAVCDSFFIRIEREFPDQGVLPASYLKKCPATRYKDTITFRIPVDVVKGVGLNKFTITIDAFNDIIETIETNNTVVFPLYIYSADIVPVYPPEFAVIPDASVTLMASTGDPFALATQYVFQIDTSDYFNSPLLQSTAFSHSGGIVTWNPGIVLSDSQVYFWRVSRDSVLYGNYSWRNSSFQYIPGKRGWGQAHIFQFEDDVFRYVNHDRPNRQFVFINDVKEISAVSGYYPYIPWANVVVRVNGEAIEVWSALGGSRDGMKIIVFAPPGGDIYKDTATGTGIGAWGNIQGNNLISYEFETSSNQFLTDTIVPFINHFPDGYRMLVMSHRDHHAQEYSERLYQAFESLGSAHIRELTNTVPYIMFGEKGRPIGSATEVSGNAISDIIELTDTFHSNWNEGYVQSVRIGPASSWGSLHWQTSSIGPSTGDSVRLSVVGISWTGAEDTLIYNLPRDSADVYGLEDRINAATYPYLKLVAFFRDDSLRTSPQLKSWHVLYEGLPETAIDPSAHFAFYKDTIDEGDQILFTVATRNISIYNMDSLLIGYWIEENHIIHRLPYHRKEPHPAGDILIDTITFSTIGFQGNNALWVEMNPVNTATGSYDQLEMYHFNNIARIEFKVNSDRENPMLDVTFDGIHILDGDIVSAKPEIVVFLKDENPYLAPESISDTTIFKVYLKRPDAEEAERVYFYNGAQEILRFEPATLPDNECKIIYNPTFIDDGVYTLMVQATDISKNKSGDNSYSVNFEVINKPAVSNFLNWPNPFSTRTHFVFTLTGSEVPEDIRIVIYNISGKVVKTIDRDELGTLHIGRNITEFVWDGTDDFGDRLANGVYLYRVIVRLHNESIDHITTGADTYFKHEFGKMYLMR